MRRSLGIMIALSLLLTLLLAACGGTATQTAAPSGPVLAIQNYLQALVSKDVDKIATLSCKEWEKPAIQEVDSLQAVTAALEGVTCAQSGSEVAATLVKCQGKIIITYNTEKQQLDLNRTYRVVQSGSDWLMCGYK